jgi:hypothetical protein
MYNLLYLAKGRFPWFSEGGNKPSAKTETIVKIKENISAEDLFSGLPSNLY